MFFCADLAGKGLYELERGVTRFMLPIFAVG